jgi:hypothetical protein
MAKKSVPLTTIATIFNVHPRTILRAIEGKENVYWVDDHDPDIDVAEVALAYGCEPKVLNRMLEGRDILITADEAAAILEIRPRSFRRRRPRCLRYGGIVRFERSVIVNLSFK